MNCSYHPETTSSGVCCACGRALCPSCTHQIKERGFCQDCLVEGAELAARVRTGTSFSGNPSTAAWLSIFPALGAIYNGQYIKAVTHFAVFAALCIMADDVHGVFGLAATVFYFYMILDSYRSAQQLIQQRLLSATPLGGATSSDSNSPFWGILLIVLGLLFTARNMGWLNFGFVREAWPLLFIIVGGYLIYRSLTGKDQPAAVR
jgi:Domain of unknown function (DUF5668)